MCDHPWPYGKSYKFHAQVQLLRTFKYLSVKGMEIQTLRECVCLLPVTRPFCPWNPDVQRTGKKTQSRIKGIITAYCNEYLHGLSGVLL